jgi:hypothetical protein
MRGCPLLVLGNKQDLKGSLSEQDIVQGLGLDQEELMIGGRVWKIQMTCALEGTGLWEGLEWLVRSCKK